MSNTLQILDKVECVGDPWHGLFRLGRTELPNGSTRVPVAAPTGNGDCIEIRVPGTPAAVNTAADVEAGRTWLDYGLLAGENHVLYGTALGAMSWVVITEDGVVMRATVELSHVNTTIVKIRPLQGSTPEQTIGDIALTPAVSGNSTIPPYTPIADLLVVHRIMDISPDGRTVIIAHEWSPSEGGQNGYATAISSLTLAGNAGAVTATRSLIYQYGVSGISGIEESDTTVTMVTYRERLESQAEPGVFSERVFGPMTDAEWAAGGYDPLPPGYNQLWMQWEDETRSGAIVRKDLVGYVFDAGVLKPVKLVTKRTDTGVGWTEPHGEPRVEHGTYTREQYLEIGDFTTASAIQAFTLGPGGGQTAGNSLGGAFYQRYSNRVYGLIEQTVSSMIYYPPASPKGQATGAAMIDVSPRATFHPVTHQIVWHEFGLGALSFI